MRVVILLIIALATSTSTLAQEQPVVRAKLSPETVNVGESAELTVTVLVPTWFTRPSIYPSFELANAITRLPADSSYNVRERVGNESWSGIVRTYEIYPLLGATYRLAGQSIEVTYANPGKDPVTTAVEIPEVVIRGEVPAGAESLDPYIAGRGFSLRLNVVGELDSLDAGDAVVLEYIAELDGLPAIFIPPLAPDLELDGVSVYADAPDVEDGPLARRSEKLTLVFDAGGEFTIPDLELRYWNSATKTIETATAAGLVMAVAGPVVLAHQEDEQSAARWPQLASFFIGLVVLMLALYRWGPAAVRRFREARERRWQSEGYAFKQLLDELKSGDMDSVYRAMLRWIDRLHPGMSLRSFASRYGDESLRATIEDLSAGIYSDAKTSIRLVRARPGLVAARRRYLAQGMTVRTRSLPPLNP